MFSVKFKANIITLCWLIIIPYVFIDALSGFFVQQIGVNLRLSQVLKIIIYLLFMTYILKVNRFLFFSLTLLLFVFLVNPIIMVWSYNSFNAVSFDFPTLLRINMIIASTAFFLITAQKDPVLFQRNMKRTLYFSFFIVCLNVLIGYLGYGFYSYPSEEFGFKGFFVAGNELSALFILLSSFVLFEVWNAKGISVRYLLISFFVLLVGVSIGTKAGAAFSVVSIFIIPLIISNSKVSVLSAFTRTFFVFIFALIGMYILFFIVKDSVFYERILYVFENKGIIGVIFSDRNVFVREFFGRIKDSQGILTLLFGTGSGLPQYQFKTTEIDFFDVAMYFGFPVALFCSILSFLSVVIPLILLRKRPYAPLVFSVNFFLFFLAFIAGHVWTSGMLGISWGLINGLLVIRFSKKKLRSMNVYPIKL